MSPSRAARHRLVVRSPVQERSTGRRPARRGLILAIVLVGLFVAVLMGAAIAQALIANRRYGRLADERQQALWLAESASQRALHKLATEAGYQGETWRLTPEMLTGRAAGVAVIQVETITEPRPGTRVLVETTYPENSLHRTLHRRQLFVDRSSPGDSP